MKICVFGLWHLGCVTAACLADLGFEVRGLDLDEKNITGLNQGKAPLSEPGLNELIAKNLDSNLSFTADPKIALDGADFLWVTFDTPVDDNDRADVDFVIAKIKTIFPYINTNIKVIVSSQMPVGSTRKLRKIHEDGGYACRAVFAYSPENLRLGKALEVFRNPDRIVVGADPEDRPEYEKFFVRISPKLEWMGVESAEMTKHAINSFLAASAVFANEIASLCEYVGADAKEVERGLKSEQRIGRYAYLAPGGAIAGGTLNRDVAFLNHLSAECGFPAHLLNGIAASNNRHKLWAKNRLERELASLKNKNIGILGLTYKPGTDTLRRSLAVELCRELAAAGAKVAAYDPAVKKLDAEHGAFINLAENAVGVFRDADCVVVCTEWRDFKTCLEEKALASMRRKILLDVNAFLRKEAEPFSQQLKYISFGSNR